MKCAHIVLCSIMHNFWLCIAKTMQFIVINKSEPKMPRKFLLKKCAVFSLKNWRRFFCENLAYVSSCQKWRAFLFVKKMACVSFLKKMACIYLWWPLSAVVLVTIHVYNLRDHCTVPVVALQCMHMLLSTRLLLLYLYEENTSKNTLYYPYVTRNNWTVWKLEG